MMFMKTRVLINWKQLESLTFGNKVLKLVINKHVILNATVKIMRIECLLLAKIK